MEFGVCAIVSSECVGCDSNELARTRSSFALDCSVPPSYLGRFRKMPPVQLKNLPPLTYAASEFFPLLIHWLCPMKYNTFSDTLIFSYWEVLLSHTSNLETVSLLLCLLLFHHSFCFVFVFFHISQCKPTPALLASSNWGEHYSRALYRQQFCWVIIVYVGCILGDCCRSNTEFVTHFAEWALWCRPCWIFYFSSTSS